MTKNAVDKQRNDQEMEVRRREAAVKESAEQREKEIHPYRKDKAKYEAQSATMKAAQDTGDTYGGAYRFNADRWGSSGVAKILANDFSFYTKTNQAMLSLLKQANTSQGSKGKHLIGPKTAASDIIQDDANGLQLAINPEFNDYKAGIYTYSYIPALPPYNGKASAVALASRKFNTLVRGDNSGSTNYDSIDLFMYPLATDSIVTVLAWCERCLSLINYKETRDIASYSDQLLYESCFSNSLVYKTFLRRYADIINIMNNAVVAIAELNIPFELDYIKRHIWLTRSVFRWCEGYSKRYAVFNPVIYRYTDEANGQLKAVKLLRKLVSGASTVDDVLDNLQAVFDQMVNPLADSQAYATMSGDIHKAFGNGAWTLTEYPLDYVNRTDPFFEENVKYLQSIKNATLVSINHADDDVTDLAHADDFNFKQDIDSLGNPFVYMGFKDANNKIHGPRVITENADCPKWTINEGGSYVFDEAVARPFQDNESVATYFDYYDYENISEEDVLYNTRFAATWKYDAITSNTYLTDCATEILSAAHVYWFDPLSDGEYNGERNTIYQIETALGDFDATSADTSDIYRYTFSNPSAIHKFYTLAREHFVPKIMLIGGMFVSNTDNTHDALVNTMKWNGSPAGGTGSIYELIWSRNNNRKSMTPKLLHDILHQSVINIFMFGKSMSNGKSDAKRRNRKSSRR